MKTLLVAAALAMAACGGTENGKFAGDTVVAELRDSVPFCSTGESGPNITTRTATTTDENGNPFQSQILQCDWTCGNIGEYERIHVFVVFYTDANGKWSIDPHADALGVVAPASCP